MITRRKSPADLLADVGRALYGDRWRIALSRDLGIDDETMRRWMTGRTELPAIHGVFGDALTLLRRRELEIGGVAGAVEKLIERTVVSGG